MPAREDRNVKYVNTAISKYLSDLAGDLPVPGGGSAAALVAATGVALLLMPGRFTLRKPGSSSARKSVSKAVKKLIVLERALMTLIDRDAEVFAALLKIKKNRHGLRNERRMQKALKMSAGVPMRVCALCEHAITVSHTMLIKGNRNLLTDVGCAAACIAAAFTSAKMNADINLKYICDTTFVSRAARTLARQDKAVAYKSSVIIGQVKCSLKKK